ncbi:hypothetical protein SDC9_192392 [bioreactor metagenome]|uniref:Uncharacterized protein n=1 Tax=bioreactor metagenome TaxID=1076179 RepID=A0A645I0M2_9ZZZZ
MVGSSDGGQCIELVVHAGQAPAQLRHFFAAVQHGKVAGIAIGTEVADSRAEAPHFAPAALGQHAGQALLQAIAHHTAG